MPGDDTPTVAEEMQASADIIELALTAYLQAHRRFRPEEVTAVQLIRWVKSCAERVNRSEN